MRAFYPLASHPMVYGGASRLRSPAASIAHWVRDRKSTRLNSSHSQISYAVFCLKKKKSTILRRIPSRALPSPPAFPDAQRPFADGFLVVDDTASIHPHYPFPPCSCSRLSPPQSR